MSDVSGPCSRGRPALKNLPLPPRRFDLEHVDSFETKNDAAVEDRERARRLRVQAQHDLDNCRQLHRLADRIDPDVTSEPTSPASSRYMRNRRRRVLGAIWEVLNVAKI